MLKDDIRKEYLEVPRKVSPKNTNLLNIDMKSKKFLLFKNLSHEAFNFQKENDNDNILNGSYPAKIIQVKWFITG